MGKPTEDIEIVQVVVFQPDSGPAIFNVLNDEKIAKINAGLMEYGVTKVAVQYKNGEQTVFIGMAYTIETRPKINNKN